MTNDSLPRDKLWAGISLLHFNSHFFCGFTEPVKKALRASFILDLKRSYPSFWKPVMIGLRKRSFWRDTLDRMVIKPCPSILPTVEQPHEVLPPERRCRKYAARASLCPAFPSSTNQKRHASATTASSSAVGSPVATGTQRVCRAEDNEGGSSSRGARLPINKVNGYTICVAFCVYNLWLLPLALYISIRCL